LVAIVAPVSAMPVGAVVVSVPPHTVADAFATVKPVGNVSVNATPVNASTFAAGLVIVKVNEVVAFSAIVFGLNTLAIDGGASTFTLADAVPPVPPSVEVTLLVALFCCPAAMPVTFTTIVHAAVAARLPPLSVIVFVFWVAVTAPLQSPTRPFGVEIIRPAGRTSVKPIPVSVDALGLVMVKVRDVEPFNGILAAPKALLNVGGATTVICAVLLVVPPPLSVAEIAPVVLLLEPTPVPWTSTEIVQDPLAAKTPEDKLMVPVPPVAVTEPPQLLVTFGVEATSRPAGKLSLNEIPLKSVPAFGF